MPRIHIYVRHDLHTHQKTVAKEPKDHQENGQYNTAKTEDHQETDSIAQPSQNTPGRHGMPRIWLTRWTTPAPLDAARQGDITLHSDIDKHKEFSDFARGLNSEEKLRKTYMNASL
jgi:hypothetical protein